MRGSRQRDSPNAHTKSERRRRRTRREHGRIERERERVLTKIPASRESGRRKKRRKGQAPTYTQ